MQILIMFEQIGELIMTVVLAEIEGFSSIGFSYWFEVVEWDSEAKEFCSFEGSTTFTNGEKVIALTPIENVRKYLSLTHEWDLDRLGQDETKPPTMEPKTMQEINQTLSDRGKEYGEFSSHADLSQKFKQVARSGEAWPRATPAEQEAVDMILHKLARILNGNPHHADSWHDIVGYATLAEMRIGK